VPFGTAARFWIQLGFSNFGGPTGQIAIMHDHLVERARWIGEETFLHALSFCTMLPGPEAQQLAIYVGWRLHGIRGGLVAGIAFVLPAAVAMMGLAWAYAAHGQVDWVASVFEGLAAAVVGIVAAAAIAIGGRAVRTWPAGAIAIVAFLAVWLVGLWFPAVVVAAALTGAAIGASRLGLPDDPDLLDDPVRQPWTSTLRVGLVCLAAWWVPILAVLAVTGPDSVYGELGLFFSQTSLVTFGGAYAVLAYVGQQMIARFGLLPVDVVTGLGLAETTPGPLILVVQFLAFLAAYRSPGDLPPVVAGTIGATIALWATFAPCFLWVFVGAPYIERLRANAGLRAALAGIIAAVLGVMAGLATTLATAVLFTETWVVRPFRVDVVLPRLGSLDPVNAAIAVAAFVALRRFKVHVAWIVLASGVAGLAATALR
jgi:chromate transporter